MKISSCFSVGLATIGVCVFGAVTSVAALFDFMDENFMDELIIVIPVEENEELINEANELLFSANKTDQLELKSKISHLITKILEYLQSKSNPIVAKISASVKNVPTDIRLVYYHPEMDAIVEKLYVKRNEIVAECNFNTIKVMRNAIELYN